MNLSNIDIKCARCGQEMRFETHEFSPGSNNPCFVVLPCCMDEDKEERIDYVTETILDEMCEYILDIEDQFNDMMEMLKTDEQTNNFYLDSKFRRIEISDGITSLKNEIKDLIKNGIY